MTAADLQRHPLSAAFGDMPPDEFADLVADIKKNGQLQPIVYLRDEHDNGTKVILDGWHRYRACVEAGIAPWLEPLHFVTEPAAEKSGHTMTPIEYVIAQNAHRRHLSREQRRQIVVELLKAKPEASDRAIAAQAKVSPTTVGAVRSELESTVQVGQLTKRVGKDGKTRARPAKAPKPAPVYEFRGGLIPYVVAEPASSTEPQTAPAVFARAEAIAAQVEKEAAEANKEAPVYLPPQEGHGLFEIDTLKQWSDRLDDLREQLDRLYTWAQRTGDTRVEVELGDLENIAFDASKLADDITDEVSAQDARWEPVWARQRQGEPEQHDEANAA
jgi:ParB-like chromosome segregation protein Spo0J